MASKAVCTLMVLVSVVGLACSRRYLKEGDVKGADLIYYDIHDKVGIPLMKRDEDIEVNTVGEERIKAVVVNDISIGGAGEAWIGGGGLHQGRVSIHLTAPVGDGYRFLVKVYAK